MLRNVCIITIDDNNKNKVSKQSFLSGSTNTQYFGFIFNKADLKDFFAGKALLKFSLQDGSFFDRASNFAIGDDKNSVVLDLALNSTDEQELFLLVHTGKEQLNDLSNRNKLAVFVGKYAVQGEQSVDTVKLSLQNDMANQPHAHHKPGM